MGSKFRFVLPMAVYLPRKTKEDRRVILNKNNAQLGHRHVYNQCKTIFKPTWIPTGWPSPPPEKIRIRYFVQRMTKAKFDTMNYIYYVDKFFLDWLVYNGYIKDDDFRHVCYGGIDGANQRAESRVLAEIEIIEDDGLQIKP